MVTPIRTILRAATGDCDPYAANVGVAYCITPYTTEKSCSHGGFLRRSQGHQQLSSEVIGCDPGCNSEYGKYWSDHRYKTRNRIGNKSRERNTYVLTGAGHPRLC